MDQSAQILKVLNSIDSTLKKRSSGGSTPSRSSSDTMTAAASTLADEAAIKKQNKLLKAQQMIAEKLKELMQDYQEMYQDNINYAQKINEEYGKQGETLKGVAKILGDSLNNVLLGMPDKVKKAFGKIADTLKKPFKILLSPVKGLMKMSAQFLATGHAAMNAKTKLEAFAIVANGLSKMVGNLISAALNPLVGALSAIGSIATTAFSVIKNGISMLTKSAKYLITIPAAIFSTYAEIGGKLRKDLVETIGSAAEATQDLFDGASNSGGALTQLGKVAKGSLLSFENYDSQLARMFGPGAGGAATMIGEVSKSISDMGAFSEIFADGITKNVDSVLEFTKATRILGLESADISYIAREARKNMEPLNATIDRMGEALNIASKEFNVNFKRMSKEFFALRKDIINFGHLSDIELAKVTGRMMQLGVTTQDVTGIFNKFSTFEDAANSAALLSQTFGMNIDALKLIRAENPMEIVEMFRESMYMTGRSFDDLNRHEKALMAQHTGMSAEVLKSVMNYRDVGYSYQEIQKRLKDSDPENQKIKSLQGMNSAMKEMLRVMNDKNPIEVFFDGLKRSIYLTTGIGKRAQQASRMVQNFFNIGLKSKTAAKAISNIFAPANKLIDDLIGKNGLLKPGKFQKEFTKTMKSLGNMTKLIFGGKDGKGDLPAAQAQITANLSNLKLEQIVEKAGFFGKAFMIGGRFVGNIIKMFAAFGPGLIKMAGRAFRGLAAWMSGKGKGNNDAISLADTFQKIFSLSDDDLKGVKEVFKTIGEEINNSDNYSAFNDFFKYIKNKIIKPIFVSLGEILVDSLTKGVGNYFDSADWLNSTAYQAVRALQAATKLDFRGQSLVDKAINTKLSFSEIQKQRSAYGQSQEGAQFARIASKVKLEALARQLEGHPMFESYEGLLSGLTGGELAEGRAAVGRFGFLKKIRDIFIKENAGKRDQPRVSSEAGLRAYNAQMKAMKQTYEFLQSRLEFFKSKQSEKSKKPANVSAQNDFSSSAANGSYFYDARSGQTSVFNPNDQFVAGMEGGPVVNSIRYSGNAALASLKKVEEMYAMTVGTGSTTSDGEARPIEIALHVDSEVVTKVLLKNDFIGKAGMPHYTLGSQRLSDIARINPTGGSTEGTGMII